MLGKLEKDVLKFVALMSMLLMVCRLTDGWFAWILALTGCIACLCGRTMIAITSFIFVPTLIYYSPVLVSGSQLGAAARIGQVAILFSMMLSPVVRKRAESIPLGWLFVYAVIAVFSSVNGWMPLISYLKIVNFVVFVASIMLLLKMIQSTDEVLYRLRVIMLGFAVFIVIGSVIAFFIPSVGYSMEVSRAESWGVFTTGGEVASREGKKLFNGVLNHSQALANNIPLWFGFVMCDLLLIERKFSFLHVAIILSAPVLMYMSRSRTALVVFVVLLVMISFYCVPRSRMNETAKRRVKGVAFVILFLALAGAVIAQIQGQAIAKWIRKVDDISLDGRSLGEAFTESRLGLFDYNLRDFELNPILGMGFQVMDWHAAAYKAGRITLFSAPIEKGVLPAMILGETGLAGGAVFLVFLISFYSSCFKRKYRVMLCLFTGLMASNMSEASFFSPGGAALQWTTVFVGGMGLDLILKRREAAAFRRSEWG